MGKLRCAVIRMLMTEGERRDGGNGNRIGSVVRRDRAGYVAPRKNPVVGDAGVMREHRRLRNPLFRASDQGCALLALYRSAAVAHSGRSRSAAGGTMAVLGEVTSAVFGVSPMAGAVLPGGSRVGFDRRI